MFRNLLTVAFRNLLKRKGHALFNIAGLAIGMACCLLIFEYVAYERSYDNFHENSDRIYRVQDEEYLDGRMVQACAAAMPALAPAMKRDFPEVEAAFRMVASGFLLSNDARDTRFNETKVYYADPSIIDVLNLPLIKGDPKTALSGPGKILLSEDQVKKYFGSEDPMGQSLVVHSSGKLRPLLVTGVFKNYPANSHIQFNLLVSYPTYSVVSGSYGEANDPVESSWDWTNFYTYVLLRKNADTKKFETKLPGFIDKYFNNLPKSKAARDRFSLSLMPIKNIHLYSHFTAEEEVNGDGQSVSFLFFIAFAIIVIAWINYINLATARSVERAREVGVRKVLGAFRRQLIAQFMMESFIMNFLALLVSLIIVLTANPFFALFTGKPLHNIFTLPVNYLQAFTLLFLMGTFLSGIYPALVLSRYDPITVLKGLFKNAAGGQFIRKSLTVGQFTASIILISATLIIYRQINYMRSKNLGVDIHQTLVLEGADGGLKDSAYQDVFQSFRQDVLQLKNVESITASSSIIGEEILWNSGWKRLQAGNEQIVNLFHLGVDYNFTKAYDLKFLAGRNFSKTFTTDRQGVILNQSAVNALGFTSAQSAIGALLKGGQRNMDSLHVVGVIADYHSEGLQKSIQPLVLLPNRDRRAYYSVKIHSAHTPETIAAIQSLWKHHFPDDPYTYFFLDEFFERQYAGDQHFGDVFSLFASLTLIIACFGLMGLSSYNIVQRLKEISVRKVLGASVRNLFFILTKDFFLLICIAILIAIPLTYFGMHNWLNAFAYHIAIDWWVFALSGILAIAVVFIVAGIQAIKAAHINPVKSLRG